LLALCQPGCYRRGVLSESVQCSVYLSHTDSEIIFSAQESPEGGYEARALGYCIFIQVDSLEELKAAQRDAVACHFDDAQKPSLIRLQFVKDEVSSA
jgi:hypothetical protein